MKTSIKTLATLLVATTLAFVSCKKEENVTPINNDTTPTAEQDGNILQGTAWVCHMENTYMFENVIPMNITLDASLDFNDTINGELYQEITLEVPAYPSANQSEDFNQPFTYTFSDNTVRLTCIYEDEEEGEMDTLVYVGIYDKVANTISIDIDDVDMEEIMGSDLMVFTPRTPVAKKSTATTTTDSKPLWNKMGKGVLYQIILSSLSR